MLFIFKQKTVVVDCFTTRTDVYEHSKIQKSTKFYPQWWKDLPEKFPITLEHNGMKLDINTMKYCNGFIEYFKSGFIMPMWTGMKIHTPKTKKHYAYVFSDMLTHFIEHHEESMHGLLSDKNFHLKMKSPWSFKCKDNIKFNFLHPVWNYSTPFEFCVLPGVVDFKYQNTTNINMLFQYFHDDITINQGTPIVHYIPQTEKRIKVQCHLISENEHNKMFESKRSFSFGREYDNWKKVIDNSNKKCPFSPFYSPKDN